MIIQFHLKLDKFYCIGVMNCVKMILDNNLSQLVNVIFAKQALY